MTNVRESDAGKPKAGLAGSVAEVCEGVQGNLGKPLNRHRDREPVIEARKKTGSWSVRAWAPRPA